MQPIDAFKYPDRFGVDSGKVHKQLVDLFFHGKCCQRQTNRDKDAS